jgi:small-conductance mechanosensitive channel
MDDGAAANGICAMGTGLVRLLSIAVLALVLFAGAARAQASAEPLPDRAALDRLIATLEDEGARAALIADLQTLRDASAAVDDGTSPGSVGSAALAFAEQRLRDAVHSVGHVLAAITEAPAAFGTLGRVFSDGAEQQLALQFTGALILVLGAGYATAIATRRILAGVRGRIEPIASQGRLRRWAGPVLRLLLDLVPVGAYLVVCLVVMGLVAVPRWQSGILLGLVNAGALYALSRALLRMLLAPRAAALRPFEMPDETARSLYRSLRWLAGTAIWGYFIVGGLYVWGIGSALRDGLLLLLGLAVAIQAVVMILRWRRSLVAWLEPLVPPHRWFSVPLRLLFDVWHLIAIAYVLVAAIVWGLRIEGGFAFLARATASTVLVILLARFALFVLDRLLEMLGPHWLSGPSAARRRGYHLPIRRGAAVLVAAVAAALILDAWGLGLSEFLATEEGRIARSVASSILLVLVVAFVVWELASTLIERRLAAADGLGLASPRTRTLLPLMRSVLLGVLVTLVALIALSQLGIDIAPLLAGAGVVGLAVGFGAQTLVKDIVTGLFMLFEDQVQIGDVVDVGGNSGVVEAMTIRTMRLRDEAGTVHIVPFSTVDRLRNLTRDFAFYVFNVGVPYREDTDHIVALLREVGAELQADPTFGPLVLADLEIIGVDAFTENGVTVKARFQTLPIKQWAVGREFNRRMKKRFDLEGIEIAQPQTTIHLSGDRDGKGPPLRVVMERGE